jgi:hypothetical protein
VAVIDCLEDPDDTLKLKTLELLVTMTKSNNVQVGLDLGLQSGVCVLLPGAEPMGVACGAKAWKGRGLAAWASPAEEAGQVQGCFIWSNFCLLVCAVTCLCVCMFMCVCVLTRVSICVDPYVWIHVCVRMCVSPRLWLSGLCHSCARHLALRMSS